MSSSSTRGTRTPTPVPDPDWWAEARWQYTHVPGTTEQSLMATFRASRSQVRRALKTDRLREQQMQYYFRNGKQRITLNRITAALSQAMEEIYREPSE